MKWDRDVGHASIYTMERNDLWEVSRRRFSWQYDLQTLEGSVTLYVSSLCAVSQSLSPVRVDSYDSKTTGFRKNWRV